jgi:hypothetical protein
LESLFSSKVGKSGSDKMEKSRLGEIAKGTGEIGKGTTSVVP